MSAAAAEVELEQQQQQQEPSRLRGHDREAGNEVSEEGPGNTVLRISGEEDEDGRRQRRSSEIEAEGTSTAATTSAVPDGGYGWIVVLSAAVFTFWFSGIATSWGVMQTALLQSGFTTTSTISFVGTLSNTTIVALGLIAVRFMRLFGARATGVIGILMFSLGEITSSFVTDDVGGLFGTTGVLLGMGASLLYMSANTVPKQWFGSRLGLANGIVKGAGGIGGTVLAVGLDAMIKRVGIPWTFRIMGILTFSTGMPAAWFLKERTPIKHAPFVDMGMFKDLPFVAVFIAGAIGTFALFVPPFFLPLFAQSIGLSSGTGAGLVAGFNLCTTVGRFGAGISCDRIGPVNTFLCAMVLNAISTLAIWPVSSTLAPLIIFAMLNGVANGAFFTSFPTVVANMFAPQRAAVAMVMATTGWSGGYLMGAPIAGFLLQSQGGLKSSNISPYRPAIFYAGGIACAASAFVLVAKLKMDRKIIKRL